MGERANIPKKNISDNNGLNRNNTFFFQPKLTINQPNDVYEKEADDVADKVMRMHDASTDKKFFSSSVVQRKCTHCEKEEKMQRKETNSEAMVADASTENYIGSLYGKGKSLTQEERSFFEPRFGYDFSNVQLHTSDEASQSAKSVNALAYTHGNNIVFGSGQYQSNTDNGKQLMAHELTHVVQQNSGISPKRIQRISCAAGATAPPRVAQGQANTRDPVADTIIAIAANTTRSISDRGIAIVQQIICTYYPSQAALVHNVTYPATNHGLETQSIGSGSSTTADIYVSDDFVTQTTNAGFARRVLQTGHELEHIEQFRRGLTGNNNKNEREFLAFHQEALADEFQGTGRMNAGTRLNLIDGALGYYYCLDPTKQTNYATQLSQLTTRRSAIVGSVSNPPSIPTTCLH